MREETHQTPESLISSAGNSARKDKDTWLRRQATVHGRLAPREAGHHISLVVLNMAPKKRIIGPEMKPDGSGFLGHGPFRGTTCCLLSQRLCERTDGHISASGGSRTNSHKNV